MAAKFARLTLKIAIKLHLVAESCTICSSRSRRPVRKLLDTLSYVVLKKKTNSMKQGPSCKAKSHSASQDISRPLRNPKAHYSVHKTRPLVPILSQMYPIHTFPTYFPKIRCNIILQPTHRSSAWYRPFCFRPKLCNHFFLLCN
jgi:hypothetical protein